MRRRLVAFARRFVKDPHEAEDIVQEVLLRAEDGQASLRSDARAEAWLFRICRHAAIDHVRSRRVRRGVWACMPEEADDWAVPADPEGPSARATGLGEACRREREPLALGVVPAHQRLLLELHYGRGLCQALLSRLSGLSSSALRVRLYRARRRLAHEAGDPRRAAPGVRDPVNRSRDASSGPRGCADRGPQPPPRTGWRIPGGHPPFKPRRELPSAPST
jgi:RNA polymerase sigma-70 factor (ECF subfamily)